MSRSSRRRFLQQSLAATGALTLAGEVLGKEKKVKTTPKMSTRLLGSNDRIRIAVAGFHGRGQEHIREYCGMHDDGIDIVYLVDPDSRLFDDNIKKIESRTGVRPTATPDIRRALDDKSLNAVSVATPNHWHSLITIWACQAGKDVYVEKPCSHNIHEGRIAVQTAHKYKRIVQHGTQARTRGGWENAVAVVQSGQLGKLLVSRGLCYKPGDPGKENARTDIGFRKPKDPPTELDFNIWTGPAPQQPYHENLVHYRWHWFWDFGNGDIGNQGVHEMDKARWGIKGGTLPKSVISIGGRFGPKDQGQTANEQIAFCDYGDTQLIFEVRGFKSEKESCDNIWHLEQGTIVGGGTFYPKGSNKAEPMPKVEPLSPHGPGTESHFQNFIAACRTRKVEDLNADILEGHYSAALCHLANASYRLGEEVPFNPRTKALGDNKDAYETLGRLEDHLRANEFKLEGMTYRLGRKLTINPQTEMTDDAEANKILMGSYRAPFTVPETVV